MLATTTAQLVDQLYWTNSYTSGHLNMGTGKRLSRNSGRQCRRGRTDQGMGCSMEHLDMAPVLATCALEATCASAVTVMVHCRWGMRRDSSRTLGTGCLLGRIGRERNTPARGSSASWAAMGRYSSSWEATAQVSGMVRPTRHQCKHQSRPSKRHHAR